MRTALGILVFTVIATAVGLFLHSGRGEIREITANTSTSDCIGDPKTPACALETLIACGVRKDAKLCGIAVEGVWGAACDAEYSIECRPAPEYLRLYSDGTEPGFYKITRLGSVKSRELSTGELVSIEAYYWQCEGRPREDLVGRIDEAWRRVGGMIRYLDYVAGFVWVNLTDVTDNEGVFPDPLDDACWTRRFGDVAKTDDTWRVLPDYGPEQDGLGHYLY
jgi:hypothetical protein